MNHADEMNPFSCDAGGRAGSPRRFQQPRAVLPRRGAVTGRRHVDRLDDEREQRDEGG